MSSNPLANNPQNLHLTDDQIREKRRKARRTLIFISIAFISLTLLEVNFLQQRSSTIADNISVFLLFNVIIILLFVLILLITRNLIKLYNERKSKIIGSKFQTKLIFAFLILVLLPSILLFIVASKLFTYSVGNWFGIQVEQSLKQSMEVAQEYYGTLENKGLYLTQQLQSFIEKDDLLNKAKREKLQNMVSAKVEEYQLGGAILYDNQGEVIISYANKSMPQNYTNLDYADLIQESMQNDSGMETHTYTKENYLVVVSPLVQDIKGQSFLWGHILTLSKVPHNTVLKINQIAENYENYKKQRFLKLPVSANYFFTFILMTLLILFSAIWLGFYMAKGITVPIQQLAQGTRRVAEGDLNVNIDINSTDEIGLLVDSFNTMTRKLKGSQLKVEQAHENLKKTNIELDRRRYYTETVLENIGAGVITIDKKGIITTLNSAAKRLLKTGEKDIVGSSYRDAFDHNFHQPIRQMIKKMSKAEKESQEEQVEITIDDKKLTMLANIKFLRDDRQKYLGLLIVFEDVTELIKAQKISAWQEVAQGIAHEIKNPLTPIQLNTQRLKKKYYEDKRAFAKVFDESIRIISQEVEGMKDLVNEFLRFSRMPMPRPRMESLHKIIEDVTHLYTSNEKSLKIKRNLDPNINLLNIDPEQIRRVFINLFDNAFDAMEEKGIIQINTRWDTLNKKIIIDFSDNGSGISPEDRNKLFLPHFTTKKRGTGLGLAIVNRIISDHGGTITVRNNEPRGTIFSIELPDSSSTQGAGTLIEPNFSRRAQPPK